MRSPSSSRVPVSVVYLAHLSESERQLAATLVLTRLAAWSRRQPGSSSLRCALLLDEAWGYVKALDVYTGDLLWEHKLLTPPWNGVMATAGGLVFGASNEGNLFALDAETGASLWDLQAGA